MNRVLNEYNFSNNLMTPTYCSAVCTYRNYTFAGVENGNECCKHIHTYSQLNTIKFNMKFNIFQKTVEIDLTFQDQFSILNAVRNALVIILPSVVENQRLIYTP